MPICSVHAYSYKTKQPSEPGPRYAPKAGSLLTSSPAHEQEPNSVAHFRLPGDAIGGRLVCICSANASSSLWQYYPGAGEQAAPSNVLNGAWHQRVIWPVAGTKAPLAQAASQVICSPVQRQVREPQEARPSQRG